MANCPKCGADTAEQDAFCRKCGAALRAQAADKRSCFMEDMAATYHRRLKDRANDPDALYNVALTLLYSERYAEAVEKLQCVVKLLPDFTDAGVKLAVALWNSGQRHKALQAIEQVLAQAPDDQKALKLQAQMQQALQK
ncbi:MAG: tetratricopeptide repeat protein [Armatimonadia bacterium]